MRYFDSCSCVSTLLFLFLFVFIIQGQSAKESRRPPKIETKDGSLVLKAGEDGDIVFEPDAGHQVRIGSLVLNANSSSSTVQGPKGDPGIPGPPGLMGNKGDKGESGINGSNGNQGPQGSAGKNGKDGVNGTMGPKGEEGPQGPPGVQGAQGLMGPQGPPGPPGPMAKVDNSTLNKSCNDTKDYGQIKYFNYNVQVCTPTGWKNLAFKEDNCDNTSVPRIDLETFKISTFGALFQFNGDLSVNLSPGSAARNVNLTAAFEDHASNNTVPEYLPSAMGKAIHFQGKKHINLDGIPADFWSRNDWSVMALIKFTDQGLNSGKEVAIIGAGEESNHKGFHLGIRSQRVLHGFYSNDMTGDARLNYDQWYQVTWTWKKTPPTGTRQIFINGVLDKKQERVAPFAGKSNNTEIGAWWDNTLNRKNNIQIDTLYIIDKVVDYKSRWTSTDWLELCQARLVNNDMP